MEASKEDILATKPDCLAGGGIEAKAETIGINKTNMEPARVFMLSIMAGMQIGMGALFMTFVKADQSLGFAASSVLGGFCFALGLICVIVAGAELFTGNSLMIIAKASDKISWAALLKNWGLVWVGNLVGSLLLVGIITGCGLMGTQTFASAETVNTIGDQMVKIASAKMSLDAGQIIFRGIMCNLLVCLAVWMGFAASSVLGGFCFALGLICVIVAGAELFTGNSLMIIAKASDKISWAALLKNWGLVWVGNLVGSLLLVGIITGCGLMGTQTFASAETVNTIGDQMVKIASAKMSLDAGQIIFRGIMCNLLVCLAVWMGFAGRTVIDKIFTTIFPVMAFVAMGFEHCVANMFFLPMGIIASNMGFGAGALAIGGAIYNILLATIGNIIGGAVFVGLIYWFSYRSK